MKACYESLISSNPKEEYIDLYLNSLESRKKIDQLLKEDLLNCLNSNKNDFRFCINFSNNVLIYLIKENPYYLEFNIITETLAQFHNYKTDQNNYEIIKEKKDVKREILSSIFLSDYQLYFASTLEIDYKKEMEAEKAYFEKFTEDKYLSINELEELIRLYLFGTIKHKRPEILNYILKNIIINSNKVNSYLQRKVFLEKCNEILDKEDIKDLKIEFVLNDKEKNRNGYFDADKKTIYIKNKDSLHSNIVDSFLSFFHEKEHYKQLCCNETNVNQLSFAKDLFLEDVFGREYYRNNYYDISFEYNAVYKSFQELYQFIIEVAPSKIQESKEYIKKNLQLYGEKFSLDTTERIINRRKEIFYILFDKEVEAKEIKNFNLLFENTVRRRKKEFKEAIIKQQIPLTILYEYDVLGNKKNLFELLEEKSTLELTKENSKKIELYNYLIYEEEVTLKYLFENLAIMKKNRNSKHYEEVKKVLKQKLLKYFESLNLTEINKKGRNTNKQFISFYRWVISKMLKSKSNQFDNEAIHRQGLTKYEELSLCYQEIYNIFEEMKEKEIDDYLNGSIKM